MIIYLHNASLKDTSYLLCGNLFDMNPIESADKFLQTGEKFRLGHLVTEQPHPLTQNLSEWVEKDLLQALSALKQVDLSALKKFTEYLSEVEQLSLKIKEVLASGGRIFFCGCGATGRLSLTLEHLWSKTHKDPEQVQAFMAGGDVALVHAIEGFEDFPEYGANQLGQLGFSQQDLLIACTEGGETPFVIGATEKAVQLSHHKPYFIYCNPRNVLVDSVERSRKVIEDPEIIDCCWDVGPMALAGSTRMQASTVLQWGAGLALFCETQQIQAQHQQLIESYQKLSLEAFEEFIEWEAQIYKKNELIHYFVDEYAITTFTDTTERAPTFSLQAFAPLEDSLKELSLCYVSLLGTHSVEGAWQELLQREPHCLDWDGKNQLSYHYLKRFDFSEEAFANRMALTDKKIHRFFIEDEKGFVQLKIEDCCEYKVNFSSDLALHRHTLLKMLLNIHSTLVMGKLRRYKNNLMTWVKPSNGKLIDRASRYVQHLLEYEGRQLNYDEVVHSLFENMERIKATDSIVLETYKSLR